jgi:hypothetical protein
MLLKAQKLERIWGEVLCTQRIGSNRSKYELIRPMAFEVTILSSFSFLLSYAAMNGPVH